MLNRRPAGASRPAAASHQATQRRGAAAARCRVRPAGACRLSLSLSAPRRRNAAVSRVPLYTASPRLLAVVHTNSATLCTQTYYCSMQNSHTLPRPDREAGHARGSATGNCCATPRAWRMSATADTPRLPACRSAGDPSATPQATPLHPCTLCSLGLGPLPPLTVTRVTSHKSSHRGP